MLELSCAQEVVLPSAKENYKHFTEHVVPEVRENVEQFAATVEEIKPHAKEAFQFAKENYQARPRPDLLRCCNAAEGIASSRCSTPRVGLVGRRPVVGVDQRFVYARPRTGLIGPRNSRLQLHAAVRGSGDQAACG